MTQHRPADVREVRRTARSIDRGSAATGSRGWSRPTPTRRPARSARCLAAPTISRSRPTAPAPPRRSICGAARPCTSPAAHDRICRSHAAVAQIRCPTDLPTMIDFELSEEHRLLEQSVREWGARDVAPHIHDYDREHRFDRERILRRWRELGLLGISVPQEYGGAGMDYIALGLASEELEYLDTSLRVIMSVHAGLNCLSLLDVGHRRAEAALSGAAGAGQEDRRLRPDRAGAGSDARAHPDDRDEEGRPLRPQRREDLDLARRCRRSLPGHRVDRPREEEAARSVRHDARSSSSARSKASRAAR